MSSARPTGSISIPIEIIPSSNSDFYSKNNPPMQQTIRSNYLSSDFTSSPPRDDSHLKTRIQQRENPIRLIKNSEFYNDPIIPITNPKPSTSRLESDFIHPISLPPSVDISNDYRVPTNQATFPNSHDRSRSPVSQRSDSPTRPPPPPSAQQESDFKVSNDIPTTSDQQVPTTDPNTVALEKLNQIKQSLDDLHQQVDAFTGSTRTDRLYKELDEQALKLMIRCDELLDVSPDIKEKRKEMIQNVQTVVAKLESKVPLESNSNENDAHALIIYDPSTTIPELST